ncbi:MAG: hypothetical protein JNK38_29240 [Acidobacteria bacterium]|nr:hypothetical protein [Acidobacteriota bacterium]
MLADIVKIHCLKHHANFPMPRTSRVVVCREGAETHTLSNNFPAEGSWVYCCNCQTFIAWDANRDGVSLKECVFCFSSLNPRAYTCDNCAVTMVDYDDPTLRKHHVVLDWGAPQPACAGCHQFPHSTPQKHLCPVLQCEVATARKTCAFCGVSVQSVSSVATPTADAHVQKALAEAEARAREADERRQLAEEAARKEIELRRQAELKAQEIEKRATQELSRAQSSNQDSELARREAEAARQQAETEAKARAQAERLAQIAELERQEAERRKTEAEAKAREAEALAREVEERRLKAEEAARREAEMRAQAEQQAREVAQTYTHKLAETQAQVEQVAKGVKKDRTAIAMTAAIAALLLVALFYLVVTLLKQFGSA